MSEISAQPYSLFDLESYPVFTSYSFTTHLLLSNLDYTYITA